MIEIRHLTKTFPAAASAEGTPSTFDALKDVNLTSNDQHELKNAIEESKLQYKIVPKSAGKAQRKAAMVFSRAFDEMDEETALKVIEILNEGDHRA